MIIWLASYPRSGNTFLRIVLHRLYGVATYSVYDDDDPVAQRIGPELVGYRPKPGPIGAMMESQEIFFVKTHKRPKSDHCPAIYLVRDGRDAMVSRARLNLMERSSTLDAAAFEAELEAILHQPYTPAQPSSGGWGGNVLAWLVRQVSSPVLIHFEELVLAPANCAMGAVSALGIDMPILEHQGLPSFTELHEVDPAFFRRGVVGSYRHEMSEAMQSAFWSDAENAEAMRRLQYA